MTPRKTLSHLMCGLMIATGLAMPATAERRTDTADILRCEVIDLQGRDVLFCTDRLTGYVPAAGVRTVLGSTALPPLPRPLVRVEQADTLAGTDDDRLRSFWTIGVYR